MLYISKPLIPPWNDSNKNLAFELSRHISKYKIFVMTTKNSQFRQKGIFPLYVYSAHGDYKPKFKEKIKVFNYLLAGRQQYNLYHFFFTPNLMTSVGSAFIIKLKKKKAIQTITSTPQNLSNIRYVKFTNHIVTLSDHTKSILHKKNINKVSRIYPGINTNIELNKNFINKLKQKLQFASQNEQIILYPGDYEFRNALSIILKSIPIIVKNLPNIKFIFACRLKTSISHLIEKELKKKISKLGLSKYVFFFNEIEEIKELISISDLCVFPVDSLAGKMDLS